MPHSSFLIDEKDALFSFDADEPMTTRSRILREYSLTLKLAAGLPYGDHVTAGGWASGTSEVEALSPPQSLECHDRMRDTRAICTHSIRSLSRLASDATRIMQLRVPVSIPHNPTTIFCIARETHAPARFRPRLGGEISQPWTGFAHLASCAKAGASDKMPTLVVALL